MTFALVTQFHVYLPWGHHLFSIVSSNSVLNVKAVVAAFNQEKALVGAFYMITNLRMDFFEALAMTGPTLYTAMSNPLELAST